MVSVIKAASKELLSRMREELPEMECNSPVLYATQAGAPAPISSDPISPFRRRPVRFSSDSSIGLCSFWLALS